MDIQAFVFDKDIPEGGRIFVRQFLNSPDFGAEAIKQIARSLGISVTQNKELQIDDIIEKANTSTSARMAIIHELVGRDKGWLAIKKGKNFHLPQCNDPTELLTSRGNEEWYGPVILPNDNTKANWYIRPQFFDHWTMPENKTDTHHFIIRWLCFARIHADIVSLHWRGFTHAEDEKEIGNNKRLASWEYVPKYFVELMKLLKSRLDEINLHYLIIHFLWDRYRYDKSNFAWSDLRIRAQGEGVALSARAGSFSGLDINGIKGLASAIRKSIQRELEDKENQTLPEPAEHFDEVILRTLIQEFGALSYEFSLETSSGERLFRAHSYFGVKPIATSDDAFAHLHVFISWRSDLEQLQFLLDHLDAADATANTITQHSLF